MLEFDPYAEDYFDDPFAVYRRLRDEAPDYYHPELDCFFLSRFEDIWRAVSSGHFSHRLGTTSGDLLIGKLPHRALSSMVPPQHTALRKLLYPHFSPSSTRALEPFVRELVRGFLREGLERGEMDANTELARRVSSRVAFRIIGLPQEDAERAASLVASGFDRAAGVKGATDAAMRAQASLHGYLGEAVAERRRRPGPGDLLDRLLACEIDGRPLPDEQIVSNLNLLVVGGTETLPKVFAGGACQLWRHPDQRAELVADPGLVPDAFWEILRYEMPTLMLGASAEVDTEICGGTPVRAGQKVMHLWVSANRDEREFPDPDRFDIHRRAPRILTFNHARHRCLGANVAQLEGRVLFEELLAAAPDYAIDEDRIVPIRSEFFRGYDALPIVFAG